MKRRAATLVLALLVCAAAAWAQAKGNYSIDPAKSKIEINVSKEGAFKAFGHDHLIYARDISGQVQFDLDRIEQSTVRLKIPTKSIEAVDPGESEKDRRAVQETMSSDKVLDVTRFPEITFSSISISAAKKTSGGWELTLSGKLTLHGVEKPVSFPLRIHAEGAELSGLGELSILQTDYGITPVKVGGGTVKVKDQLKITFTIVAHQAR